MTGRGETQVIRIVRAPSNARRPYRHRPRRATPVHQTIDHSNQDRRHHPRAEGEGERSGPRSKRSWLPGACGNGATTVDPSPRLRRIRRLLGGSGLLVLTLTLSAAEGFARHTAESSVSRTRRRHREFLEKHAAIILPARGAALQTALNDCGVAVLREALRSEGVRGIPSHDSVAHLTGLSAAGTSLSRMESTLDRLGIGVRRVDRGRVLPDPPFVAHLSMGHFVLVRDLRARHVRFFDPMIGEVLMHVRTFDSLWSGAAFALASPRERDDRNVPHCCGSDAAQTPVSGRSQ